LSIPAGWYPQPDGHIPAGWYPRLPAGWYPRPPVGLYGRPPAGWYPRLPAGWNPQPDGQRRDLGGESWTEHLASGVPEATTALTLLKKENFAVAVGRRNMAMVDRLTPPLTTVRLPLHQIGELSARLLLAEIEGGPQGSRAVQSLLGVELVVRGTTARPRSD